MTSFDAVSLSEVADVIRGVTYSKSDVVEARLDTEVPILRAGNIGRQLTLDDDLVWVPKSLVSSKQLLRQGDIVMCMSSGSVSVLGKSALLKKPWSGSFGAFCAVIRADRTKIDPEFLHYILQGESFREWSSQAQGNNIKNINKSSLEEYTIRIPQLLQQKSILKALKQATSIKDGLGLSQEKTRSFIPALFVGMFGRSDAMTSTYPCISMDEAILEKRIGLVKSTREQIERGAYGYIRMNSVTKDGKVNVDDIRRVDVSEEEADKYQLHNGDILFNTRNSQELVGKMGVYSGGPGNVFNNNLMRIRLVSALLPEFVNAYFQSTSGRETIEAIKKGTTSVSAVYYKDLAKIRLPVPAIELQERFVKKVKRVNSVVSMLESVAYKAHLAESALSSQLLR